MSYGVALDALNPAARPSPARLVRFGVTCARLIASDDQAFYDYDKALGRADLDRYHVYTGSTFDGAADMATRARQVALRVWSDATAVIANEWDVDGDASWPPGGEDAFVGVWNTVAPAISAARADSRRLWVGGLFDCGAALDRLERVLPRLDPQPSGVDLHPYTLSRDAITMLLSTFHERWPSIRVGILEWNDSARNDVAADLKAMGGADVSMFLPWTGFAGIDLPGLVSPKTGAYTALGKAYRSAIKESA